MAFFVKVIPPGSRARIHGGECRHCRDGRGQKTQDKGHGPTYWEPAYPKRGFNTQARAQKFMDGLNYENVGLCAYCVQKGYVDAQRS